MDKIIVRLNRKLGVWEAYHPDHGVLDQRSNFTICLRVGFAALEDMLSFAIDKDNYPNIPIPLMAFGHHCG